MHRIVAVPRNGGGSRRQLLTLTLIPWYVDVGPDDTLYFEQIDQSCEVLRFPSSGGAPERLGTSAGFRFGTVVELPGGRVLVPAELAGRSRLMVAERGREPIPLVDTTEETAPPAAMVGDRHVAFMIGTSPRRAIAIASVADGRIVRRLKGPSGDIESLAVSTEGKTLYYAASRKVWAIPVEDGKPRWIADGDDVVAAPGGRELIVKLHEKDGSRLIRLPASGTSGQAIPFHGDLRLTAMPLAPNAVAKDGRILVQVAALDSWFWRAAILDPSTGQVTRIPIDYEGDLFFSGWASDGRILALGIGIKGGVWRFHPERAGEKP